MLDPSVVEDIYPLTPLQEGMLFHSLETGGSDRYVEQLCIGITGEIDINWFTESWNRVIAGNEVLRTVFRWEGVARPIQIVVKNHRIEPNFNDLCRSTHREKDLQRERDSQRLKGLDLLEVPFRVSLCKLDRSHFEMIVTNHHILYDGWSNGIILKEFFDTYEALALGKEFPPCRRPAFKTYISWLKTQNTDRIKGFWTTYLIGLSGNVALPMKKISSGMNSGGRSVRYLLPEVMTGQIDAFCRALKITPAALFYSAWGLLLQGVTRSADALFGTTVSGRHAPVDGIGEIVGLLVNTVPLRVAAGPEDNLIGVLRSLQVHLQEREEFATAPLIDIRQWAGVDPKADLFDTLIVVENYPLVSRLENLAGPLLVGSFGNRSVTNYDVTLGIALRPGAIEIDFLYNPATIEESIAFQLSGALESVLHSILAKPDGRVGDLALLSCDEMNRVLEYANGSTAPYFEDMSIVDLVDLKANAHPHRVALVEMPDNSQVTFRGLTTTANKIAVALRSRGVVEEGIVCVMMPQSIGLAAAIVGVMMAGCAYLPLDSAYPTERIRFLLNDSNASLCLTGPGDFGSDERMVEVAGILNSPDWIAREWPAVPASFMAYVIYTSGTTGSPKGVAVEHKNAVNMLVFRKNEYRLDELDATLQLFTFTFDGFVASFFTPLVSGCKQVFAGPDGPRDLGAVLSAIKKIWVNHFICVPSLFAAIMENIEHAVARSLSVVVLAGDVITSSLIDLARQKNPSLELVNEYGVTEAAVLSTLNRHQQNKKTITIGKPIANTRIFVVDHWGRIVPAGVPGEICIAGAGLARGYLNRPELTSGKYYDLPGYCFRRDPVRVYCTGDLGKWTLDGQLEHLGRIDHQVKIRGLRIELKEIEEHLMRLPDIKECVAVVHENDTHGEFLCAYIVPRSGESISEQSIREYMLRRLPEYMVPRYFIAIQSIPLNVSGKMDRHALPVPRCDSGLKGAAPVDSKLEFQLAEIWASVLAVKINDIVRQSDFFHLGGHSIKATVLSVRIHKKMGVIFSLNEIFKYPRLMDMAEMIRGRSHVAHRPIEPVEKKEYYPMSNAQKRLWIIHQMEDNHVAYNMTGVFRFSGQLQCDALEKSFLSLVERHEILRTGFVQVGDGTCQKIFDADAIDFSIPIHDYRAEIHPESMAKQTAKLAAAEAFDLKNAPLIRALFIWTKDEEYIFVCTLHHIIADGWSIQVLVKELFTLYYGLNNGEAASLPPLNVQYKDYSAWHLQQLSEPTLLKHRRYWVDRFAGGIPESNIPTDFPRPQVKTFHGMRVPFEFQSDITQELDLFCRSYGTSLFMVLLAITNALLYSYTGDTDFVIGSPIAGRQHEDLIDQIGFYVNTLALRTRFEENERFDVLLQNVKELTLEAYAHQIYPFDQLVDDLGIRRDSGRNPLFDVVLALQSFDTLGILDRQTDFAVEPIDLDFEISTFDLVFLFEHATDGLKYTILYNSDLFTRGTIMTIGEELIRILRRVIEEPEICLDKLVADSLSVENKFSVDSWDMNF